MILNLHDVIGINIFATRVANVSAENRKLHMRTQARAHEKIFHNSIPPLNFAKLDSVVISFGFYFEM